MVLHHLCNGSTAEQQGFFCAERGNAVENEIAVFLFLVDGDRDTVMGIQQHTGERKSIFYHKQQFSIGNVITI